MILSIGIDSVDIQRFSAWHTRSKTALQRIFLEKEISYCLQDSTKSAERFAVRFAAREAMYKALSPFAKGELPFLTLCKGIAVKKQKNIPVLWVTWNAITPYLTLPCNTNFIKSHISLSHSRNVASALVILENTAR